MYNKLTINPTSALRQACYAACAVVLFACGGGGGSGDNNFFGPGAGGGGTGTGGGSSTGGGGTGTTGSVQIGSTVGNTFTAGELALGVTMLSAGGMTTVTANLVDGNGDPVTTEQDISFTSDCVADGTAELTSTVLTENGQAVAEYTAQGCVGADEVRASVSIGGDTIRATGTITVEQDTVGSIEFVSAEPPQIALQGTGGTENSTVSFRVVGSTGAPIQNLEVDFSLNTGVGGLEILPVTATTDANGIASTVVSAGSVATSVRVTATERTSNISTQSSQLVVSTGIPDLDSFSIARTVIAVEGFNFDGITSTVTVRAADAFNNPVPDGTAISFYTEGGAIDASCSTIDSTGSCEVTWRSQNPRPTGDLFGGGDPRPGRVTVIAYAIGNESFQDQNGNGRYDDGETFTDIGEAFANENESVLAGEPSYDVGEFFVDFDQNTIRNTADGLYTGVLCAEGATCSTQTTLTVFATATIVMSTSVPSADMLFEGGVLIPQGTQLDFARGQTRQFQVFISDSNGNPMPASTTVAAAITGSDYSIGGTTGVQIQDASEPAFFPGVMTIGAPDSSAAVEVLTLTLTTPEGVVSTLSWTLNTP